MKTNINIRDYLEDNAGCGISVQAHVDTDDILQALDLPDEDEFDFDLDEVLEEQRQIAILFTIDDVKEIRPDLTDDQAWQVLKNCRTRFRQCQSIDCEAIQMHTQELYGPPPSRRWHGRIDVIINEADGYGQDEVITRLRDMAELLAKDMPDIKAIADEGSLCIVEEGQP